MKVEKEIEKFIQSYIHKAVHIYIYRDTFTHIYTLLNMQTFIPDPSGSRLPLIVSEITFTPPWGLGPSQRVPPGGGGVGDGGYKLGGAIHGGGHTNIRKNSTYLTTVATYSTKLQIPRTNENPKMMHTPKFYGKPLKTTQGFKILTKNN